MQCPECEKDYYEEFEGSSHCFGCGFHEGGYEGKVSGSKRRDINFYLMPLDSHDRYKIEDKWGITEKQLKDNNICKAIDHPDGCTWLYIPIDEESWQLRTWSEGCSARYLMKFNPPAGIVHVIGKPGTTVVVVEGVFDAIRTAEVLPSVAIFGSDINEDRITSLRAVANNFIIMLDGDAHSKALYLQKKLGVLNSKVVLLDKDKDPTDYSYDSLKELIQPLVNYADE